MVSRLRTNGRRHVGSWAIFCDIAGQVSQSPNNPVVTAVAVAVGREVVAQVRKRLVAAFEGNPVKWRRGKLPGLRKVMGLTTSSGLSLAVLQLHRADGHWARFYQQGAAFAGEVEARLPRRCRTSTPTR